MLQQDLKDSLIKLFIFRSIVIMKKKYNLNSLLIVNKYVIMSGVKAGNLLYKI